MGASKLGRAIISTQFNRVFIDKVFSLYKVFCKYNLIKLWSYTNFLIKIAVQVISLSSKHCFFFQCAARLDQTILTSEKLATYI